MEQEAPDELDRFQGHGFPLRVVGVVLPLKGDATVFHRLEPVIGDGYSIDVAGQVLEDTFGSAERRLDVNHPFDAGGFLTEGVEGGRVSQGLQFSGELESAFAKSFSQIQQELFAEQAAEDTDRKEEGGSACDPA